MEKRGKVISVIHLQVSSSHPPTLWYIYVHVCSFIRMCWVFQPLPLLFQPVKGDSDRGGNKENYIPPPPPPAPAPAHKNTPWLHFLKETQDAGGGIKQPRE